MIGCIKTILPYLPSLLVVLGWVLAYKFKVNEERRTSKIKAYERTLNVMWVLLTKASGDEKITTQEFYTEQSRNTDLELFASSEIIEHVDNMNSMILSLNRAEAGRKIILQEKVTIEYEKLVKIMRSDLHIGLDSVKRATLIHDFEKDIDL